VKEPDIVEIVYTPQEKQMMKELTDKMIDLENKKITIQQLKTQGYNEKIILEIKNVYDIVDNLAKEERNKLKDKIQELTTEKIPFGKYWSINTLMMMKALIDLEIPFNEICNFNDIKNHMFMD
jgi:hypothetical protein